MRKYLATIAATAALAASFGPGARAFSIPDGAGGRWGAGNIVRV